MTTASQHDEWNYVVLIKYIVKWWKPILGLSLIATVAAIIFSGPSFLPPKYKSTVIFYPSSTNSISKALLDENAGSKVDLLAFGEEEEAEQLLQILESDEVSNTIINRFDLMNRYRIDPEDKYKYTKLKKQFNKNVSYRRTEYMSIEVTVLDEDPQTAADIANSIVAEMDSVKNRIQRQRAQEALQIVQAEYTRKEQEIKNLENSLMELGDKYGIVNPEQQAAVFSETFTKAKQEYLFELKELSLLPKGSQAYKKKEREVEQLKERYDEADTDLKNLGKYGGQWFSLTEGLSYEMDDFKGVKLKYEQAKVDANQELSHKFVVNNATPAEKKSYPIRWLIVLGTLLSTFMFASLCFIIYEGIKANKDWLLSKD